MMCALEIEAQLRLVWLVVEQVFMPMKLRSQLGCTFDGYSDVVIIVLRCCNYTFN
jgi:hypothetical protein